MNFVNLAILFESCEIDENYDFCELTIFCEDLFIFKLFLLLFRILSRDECFDARAKTANLSALFPRGDHMVCIIDDREDVWTYAQNLVHVQPYIFFKNTGDINDPHGVLASKANKKDDPELGPERRLERRQSIDMPSIDDNEDKVEDKEVEDKDDKIQDDVSMVSGKFPIFF